LEALADHAWVTDLQGAFSVGVLADFLNLWDLLSQVVLQPGTDDKYIWHFWCVYSEITYNGFFWGAVVFSPWERIWKFWNLNKCHFFIAYLVTKVQL
jgi:hypothetical protein